jgi:hypothetical protein
MSVPAGFDSRDDLAANPSVTNHRGSCEHLFHRTTLSISVFWTNLHFLGQIQ